jgi:hypothetical protein
LTTIKSLENHLLEVQKLLVIKWAGLGIVAIATGYIVTEQVMREGPTTTRL